jgi:hypothetical protein
VVPAWVCGCVYGAIAISIAPAAVGNRPLGTYYVLRTRCARYVSCVRRAIHNTHTKRKARNGIIITHHMGHRHGAVPKRELQTQELLSYLHLLSRSVLHALRFVPLGRARRKPEAGPSWGSRSRPHRKPGHAWRARSPSSSISSKFVG